LHWPRLSPPLRSFPTRRSSDLHRKDWRAWLHLGNLLNHRVEATTITTRTRIAASVQTASDEAAGDDGPLASAQWDAVFADAVERSEEHTSELQSRFDLVCRLLL